MATRLVAMGGHLNGGPDLPAEIGQEKVIAGPGAQRPARRQAGRDRRHERAGLRGRAAGRRRRRRAPGAARRRRALRGRLLHVERRLELHRQPAGRGAAPRRAELGGLRRPVGRDPRHRPSSRRARTPRAIWRAASEWHWTAHFEAFASNFETIEGERATPDGHLPLRRRRPAPPRAGRRCPYHLESEPFAVEPWDGITVEDLRAEQDGRISFTVGPRRTLTVSSGGPTIQAEIGPIDYPDSYASPARFINDTRQRTATPRRPGDPLRWSGSASPAPSAPGPTRATPKRAWLTVTRSDGTQQRIRAQRRGDRFFVTRTLKRGERAHVAAGDVVDAFGNVNGEPSTSLKGRS